MTVPANHQRTGLSRAVLVVAALLGAGALAAGCGGGPAARSVVSLGKTTTATGPAGATTGGTSSPTDDILAFVNCMRTHGVPNMPDPSASKGSGGHVSVQIVVGAGVDPSSPQFAAASRACNHLLPNRGVPSAPRTITPADQADYLKGAACMRSHGFPAFPDPTFRNGNVTFSTQAPIDSSSTRYKRALATCQKLIPPGLPYSSSGGSVSAALDGGERFAAYLAHELRTPLSTQRALLELALGDPNTDLVDWREIGEDVLLACRQQERLVEACLTLARSSRGVRRHEPLDLASISGNALQLADLRELASVVVLEPAWTTGDPRLVERLAANLVSNAIRHNVSAGGRIEVATHTTRGRAVLSVANTGPPIPAREVTRLFQPFQRLDTRLPSSEDGVGLGLSIVQEIANAHHATVSARPRAEGGLQVDVRFSGTPRRCLSS